MGKWLACLLFAVAGIIPADASCGHEQTRRVQDELRNRHLFYGNTTGEYSPELMAALKRYQTRKGLGATGIIDRATLASLDIPGSPPPVEELPLMTAESTPQSALATAPKLEQPPVEQEQVTPSPIESDSPEPRLHYSTGELLALMRSDDEAAEPFEPDFDLASAPIVKGALGTMWDDFALEPLPPAEGNLIAMTDAAAPPAEPPKRVTHSRVPRVQVRKQKNPIVLAFASIDHAMRNLFHQPVKKKRVAKR